ncbi:CopG family transcriptional regulator [Photorhabdus khanii subsp. guanajuatensis]|uniref:CopG family transcriptional regulator n=2 Tax=Photorhabdus khanii TaxID=1004150 RepID=A0A4R4JKB7_9GAMM|nr:CopG family transcriptional regulator [Photorhabdus khanii subsp. guanajuatensis]
MQKKQTITLRLDEGLKSRIKSLADVQGISAHSLMVRSIENEIDALETRQKFLRDAENAWLEYEATGLHLTGDELSDWLDAIARGEDKDLPECHL